MFCEKCGKEVSGNEKFCTGCGNPIGANEQTANSTGTPGGNANYVNTQTPKRDSFTETQTNAETTTIGGAGALPPKKKKKGVKIIAIAVAAAVAVGTTGVLAGPYITNGIAKLVMSPSKYYRHIVKKNSKELSKDAAKLVASYGDLMSVNTSQKGSLTVEKGDGLDSILSELNVDDVDQYIGWLEKANLDYDISFDDGKLKMDYDIGVNGNKLGKIDMVADLDSETLYVGVPDYNSTYLSGSVDMGTSGVDFEDYTELLNSLGEAMPKDSDVEDIIYRYINVIAGEIDNVEEEKDTVEAGDISQKCTKLVATVDGETGANMARAFLEELKDDKDIKDIVYDISEVSDEFSELADTYDELMDDIDEVIEATDDMAETDVEILMTIWVNGKGEIVGTEMAANEATVYMTSLEKGGKFGLSIGGDVSGQSFEITGGGKASGDKRTGDLELKVMGMSALDIAVEDLDAEKLAEGIFAGNIKIKAAKSLPVEMIGDEYKMIKDIELEIKSNSESLKKSDISCGVYYDGKLCASVGVKTESGKATTINTPSDYIDANDSYELEEWIKGVDFDKLTDNLEKIGIPSEILDTIESIEGQIS